MLTLLLVGILIVVLAGIATVHATVTAPEGYEDHLGFHVASDRRDGATIDAGVGRKITANEREIPPFVATR